MGYARSATTYSPYAYAFTAVSCGLWIRYAVDWGHGALGALSWIGAALAAVYVVAFLLKAGRNDLRRDNLLCFAAGGAALLVSAVGLDLLVGKGKGSFVYNVVCCATSCFASGAPAYNLPTVAREKSMAAMPPMIVPVVALVNAILWILCNTVQVDPKDVDWFLVVSAAVAALCALGQLVLHALFWWLPAPPPPARTGILEPLVPRSNVNDEGRPDLPPSTGNSESKSDDDERRVDRGTGASNQSTATGATAATTTTRASTSAVTTPSTATGATAATTTTRASTSAVTTPSTATGATAATTTTRASTSAVTTPSTATGAQTPTRSSKIAHGTDACDVHSDIDTKTASEGSADRGKFHTDQPSDRRAEMGDYIIHVGEPSDSDGELAAANLPPIQSQQQQPEIGMKSESDAV
ncbi:hypothetical protein QYE76_037066 [Lolium multiflorum]|uniref:Uncharacterized protein n=1 Tax=Lolium multiflorum TaxID=4521 RepID=A0AAD8R640_LOLMU|nr:hypothetical protein QYE76_037066 [Lolium multiflorum]